ncbi:sulfatase-like hydrolase/transferase [Sulfitobacter porphyrae]|uniref:Sulfatase-like hydrolase/transferase n=1 Tax=Sulfitobacter porphyrae TaxID=1246864 RepID=A0ABW2BCM7_9RHOB
MYGPEHFLPPVRSDAERETDHPVFKGFQNAPVGKAFARDDIRDKVVTAYMGLIKQCDDQMGVLFDWLEKTGRMEDTMIVITSDHGDFLGDHWLGEKTFFHDASVKVPMIIYDPSDAADATRGTTSDALVECIDLAPTFVDVAGATRRPWITFWKGIRCCRCCAAARPRPAITASASTIIRPRRWPGGWGCTPTSRACSWSRITAGR